LRRTDPRSLTRPALTILSLVLVLALVGGALAYAVAERPVEALERPREARDRMTKSASFLEYLDPGSSRNVASFRLASGREHAVFLSRSRDGKQVCLFDTDLATGRQGGGCNDAGSVLAGRKLQISVGFEGGPEQATIRDLRIVGLIARGVSSVRVELSDGTSRSVELTPDRAFAWVMPQDDLDRGVVPRVVVAFARGGVAIDRAETGF
jgi:hypothetical protein